MPEKLYCSFCSKSQDEIRKLIAGPSVFICNECVGLCLSILYFADEAEFDKTVAEARDQLHVIRAGWSQTDADGD